MITFDSSQQTPYNRLGHRTAIRIRFPQSLRIHILYCKGRSWYAKRWIFHGGKYRRHSRSTTWCCAVEYRPGIRISLSRGVEGRKTTDAIDDILTEAEFAEIASAVLESAFDLPNCTLAPISLHVLVAYMTTVSRTIITKDDDHLAVRSVTASGNVVFSKQDVDILAIKLTREKLTRQVEDLNSQIERFACMISCVYSIILQYFYLFPNARLNEKAR